MDWIERFKRLGLMDKPIPLHRAAYIMVDLEPLEDEETEQKRNQVVVLKRILKPKPPNVYVDQFLRRFLELFSKGELPEVEAALPQDECVMWFSRYASVSDYLRQQHDKAQEQPHKPLQPNYFNKVFLAIDDLKLIALRMGLTPKFLESADVPEAIPTSGPALPVVNSGRTLTDLECEMVYRNRFEYGMDPQQIVNKMFADDPRKNTAKLRQIHRAINRHKDKLNKKS
jgi:hypothetical protein